MTVQYGFTIRDQSMLSSLAKVSAFSIALMFLSAAQAAENKKLIVKLEAIERIQAQEQQGDELYFSITEYSTTGKASHYQVPDFPTHWLSDYLTKVHDVVLWQRPLEKDEAVELIISLVERDVPPWNIDDLFGSVKLKLKWEGAQLKKEWSIPNQSNTSRIDDHVNAFSMTGDEGEYHLILKVEEAKEDLKERKKSKN